MNNMLDRCEIEELSFEAWWNEKGINSVILRAMALTAWMARAELEETPPVNQPARTTEEINAEYHAAQAALKPKNQKPEQWPKYCAPIEKTSTCVGKQVAYYRRDNECAGETFHTDGTSFTFAMWDNELAKTRLITEVEAMSLLKKPEPILDYYPIGDYADPAKLVLKPLLKTIRTKTPVPEECDTAVSVTRNFSPEIGIAARKEDPDEWVIQDRVPVRVGDRISWHYDNVENSVEAGCFSVGAKHGDVSHGNRLRVWCRRRDLPKGKQKTRVRLWVSQSAVIVRDAHETGFGKEIHHDAEGFYIEE